MPDSTTPNYGWAYPTVNADDSTWGGTINAAFIAIDAALFTVSGVASGASTVANAACAKANNLSDVASAATARTNLGLGTAATANAANPANTVMTVSGAITDNNICRFRGTSGDVLDSGLAVPNVALNSDNLSALSSFASARTNLGLGTAATANAANPANTVMTVSGAITDNNICRFRGTSGDVLDSGLAVPNVALNSDNLSALSSFASARTNLGVTATGADTAYCYRTNNLSDVASAATARTNLGLTRFRTAAATPSASGTHSESHGLGPVPTYFSMQMFIICTASDQGYSVGDIVPIGFGGSSRNDGGNCWVNDTNFGWSIGTNGLFIDPKGGGGPSSGINASNWNAIAVLKYN